MRRASPPPLLLAAAWTFLAALSLGASELVVRALDLDWRLLRPLLYYQAVDVSLHRASDDVGLHYELKPGARGVSDAGKTVSVNSLGFRGPERPVKKPRGVFRVVCFGASNTYGAAVADDETYPAQLERRLNRAGTSRFEVWNAGVHAYVLRQNADAARAVMERLEPDLMLFQLSNRGRRPFLLGAPFRRYFEEDPGLYAENLTWAPLPSWLRRGRFYRAVVVLVNRALGPIRRPPPGGDTPSYEAFEGLLRELGPRPKVAVFVNPGGRVPEALKTLGLPSYDLSADLPAGAGPEYSGIHPPARVYAWYAERLERHLRADGLVR